MTSQKKAHLLFNIWPNGPPVFFFNILNLHQEFTQELPRIYTKKLPRELRKPKLVLSKNLQRIYTEKLQKRLRRGITKILSWEAAQDFIQEFNLMNCSQEAAKDSHKNLSKIYPGKLTQDCI